MFKENKGARLALAALVLLPFADAALAEDDREPGVAALTAALKRGETGSEQALNGYLERIDKAEALKAFIALDREAALRQARDADAALKAGGELPPLLGVPLVIKDNIHVAGLSNTAGTPGLEAFVPKAHAPVVAKLVAAGAIILGKTNMHELAFGITSRNAAFGAVGNAYDPERFAGGSSGGSGAAIGARLAPGGLGSDTGGSVRIPAALNGIAGLRPTMGRYPGAGITPISATRDTAGPMAPGVADLELLDRVITDALPVAPAKLSDIRLAVPRNPLFQDLDGDSAAVVEAALSKLSAAGVTMVEADFPELFKLNEAVSFPVALFEVQRDLPAYLAAFDTGVSYENLIAGIASPDVKGVFESLQGEGAIPEAAYRDALDTHRPRLRSAYAAYFARHHVDAMVFPATPLPAQPIENSEAVLLNGAEVPTFPTFIRNTDPASNAGIPGLVLPAGLTPEGLPVAIELDGPAWSDRNLLAVGLALEQVLGRLPPPSGTN